MPSSRQYKSSESGLALMIVVFMVSLASVIALGMARSTYLSSQSTGFVQQQLQAEYLLKSLLSLAAGLIKEDSSPRTDGANDPWGLFSQGIEVPKEYLGLTDPNIRIFLEIRPMNTGLRITDLQPGTGQGGGSLFQKQREICLRLFDLVLPENLRVAEDHLGIFKRSFSTSDMVANLIDYIDRDTTPYQEGQFQGIESNAPELAGLDFKNEGAIFSLNELSRIPGFSPKRIQVLAPYLSTEGDNMTNINLASLPVIQALHPDLTPALAEAIYEHIRSKGPISSLSELEEVIPGFTNNMTADLAAVVATSSRVFQVIAKAEFGQQTMFIRARIDRGRDIYEDWPVIYRTELF